MVTEDGQRAAGRSMRKLLLALVGVFSIAVAPAVIAQETAAPEPVETSDQQMRDEAFNASVIVDGEPLFVVRGTSALPATERAENVANRIIDLAERPDDEEIRFTIVPNDLGRSVFANGRMITIVTGADAALEQIDIDVLAALHVEAIEAAIESYRFGRSDEARIDSATVAVGWTVAFFVFSVLFLRRRKRVIGALERMTARRFSRVEEATQSVVQGNAVARLVSFAANLILWIIYLFLLYYYLSFVLLSFAETRPVAQVLLTYVTEPLIGVLLGFVGYLPNLITLAVIALITNYLIKGLRLLMDNVEAGTFSLPNFEPHWITPTFNIGRFAIIAIAIVFAYPHIPGSDSRAFQGLTILAGIMVSLGSNTVVSNMMAGLFVIYRRSTNIGDRIKVGEQVGDVVEIKLMETLIKSIKNEMISIPNAQLLNSEVINYSRKIDGRGMLVHTTVGIGYEEPKEKIIAMLIEAANRTDSLKRSPEPFVLCTGLADFAINYQINAFTTRGSLLPRILSDLHYNIIDVFNENGVQIMTPAYETDPDELKIPTEVWDGKLTSIQE